MFYLYVLILLKICHSSQRIELQHIQNFFIFLRTKIMPVGYGGIKKFNNSLITKAHDK